MTQRTLPAGYSVAPPGHLVSAVTCLEMRARPPLRARKPSPATVALERLEKPDIGAYRALFRAIGEDVLWFSRVVMPNEDLAAILSSPDVEVHVLNEGRRPIGLLELDFREAGQCELAFFGLVPQVTGKGYGSILMQRAIERAFARPIGRFWVHTCSFDHPSALGFYIRSGFKPYAYEVECAPDPRLTGHLPRTAAPQIPIIEP